MSTSSSQSAAACLDTSQTTAAHTTAPQAAASQIAASPTTASLTTARPDRPRLDVLVVGAGPVGLFTACELLRHGLSVRLIDRAAQPAQVPRALALWPRALDILADLGVGERFERASIPITGAEYYSGGERLAVFRAPGPLQPRHLPQYETERLLTDRLHELGGKVERGVRLLNFDDLDFSGPVAATGQITSVLEHSGEDGAGSGTVERVASCFVVGADGAGSTVRGLIGAGFTGSTYELAFALVDTKVTQRVPNTLPRGRLLYYQAPTGTLMIAPLPGDVFRVLAVLPERDQEVTVEFMQQLLDARGPGGITITEPVWQTVYRVHARQATEYQRGRAFLVGDAAHVHSPAGGQGMNNGIQDAYNLAWKLAAVLGGRSPVSLLDGYTAERVEATNRIIADTDRQTRAWMAGNRVRMAVRDTAFRLAARTGVVPRYVIPVMAGRRVMYPPLRPSQTPSGNPPCCRFERLPGRHRTGMVFPRSAAVALHMNGTPDSPPGWTLVAVTRPGDAAWHARLKQVTEQYPHISTVRMSTREARAVTGCAVTGFHLVRPDGHIQAHGHAADLDQLRRELELALLPAAPDFGESPR